MTLEEDINKLKLKAGQVITQSWFEQLANALSNMSNRLLPEGRIPLSKLPSGAEGKILIAQGIDKDPVYADPLCTLVKVKDVDLTPRDWSSDFAHLPTISDKATSIDTKLNSVITQTNKIDTILSKQDTTIDRLDSIINELQTRLNLLQRPDKTIVSTCRFAHYSELGYSFRIARRYLDVDAQSTVSLSFVNPVESNRTAIFEKIVINVNSDFLVDIISNYTITDSGTDISPINQRINSTISSVLQVKENPTCSYTSSDMQNIVFTTTTISDRPIVLPPNSKLLLVFRNNTNQARSLGVDILWFEIET